MPPKKSTPTLVSKTRDKSPAVLRRDALKRLEVKWNGAEGEAFDSSGEPTVTPLLKAAEGGIPRIMEALRAHDDTDAREFVALYDSLSRDDLRHLTLEEIAYASRIGSLRLAEVATSAVILHGQMTSKLLLHSAIGAITRTSIKMAKREKGGFDREMMLKAGGVLPLPKGTQIAIQNNNGQAKESGSGAAEAEPQYLDAGERLRLIHEAVEPRRLPSPPSDPIDIGGRLSHMQDDVAEALSRDV